MARLKLDHFFALVGARTGVTNLLLKGHMKVTGDKPYALKLAGLVA